MTLPEPYYYDPEHGITLYCGDCREILPLLPEKSVDLVLTDPPFAFAGGVSNGFASKADSQFFKAWLAPIFKELHRLSTPESAWALWCDWRTAAIYDETLECSAKDYYDQRRVSQVIAHDREMVGMGSPFRNQVDWIALVRGKKTSFGDRIPKNQPNIIREYWYYGKHENHPAEKSPAIARKFVEWLSGVDGIVLDPFFGSCSVGIAAKQAKRGFVGIEREEKYCKIAVDRLRQMELFR